jgi:hypothetical protein
MAALDRQLPSVTCRVVPATVWAALRMSARRGRSGMATRQTKAAGVKAVNMPGRLCPSGVMDDRLLPRRSRPAPRLRVPWRELRNVSATVVIRSQGRWAPTRSTTEAVSRACSAAQVRWCAASA